MVSSNTPPASSAPSPTSLTFQARDGSRSSRGFRLTTCFAICTKMGLLERPLQRSKSEGIWRFNGHTEQVTGQNNKGAKQKPWNSIINPGRPIGNTASCSGQVLFFHQLAPEDIHMLPTRWMSWSFLPCGKPFYSDLRPICFALGHCSANRAHKRQSVDLGW